MSHDPWLLTPGPLTTSMSVKQSMLHDWGSRDAKFLAINTRMRSRLVAMIGGEGTFTCVPMQGSGTFAVEAMIGAFVPPAGKLLVLGNGAYCRRRSEAHAALPIWRGHFHLRSHAGLRHLRGRGDDRGVRAAGGQAAGPGQRRLRQAPIGSTRRASDLARALSPAFPCRAQAPSRSRR